MSTIKTIEGNLINASASYAIVITRWNSFIVDKLLDGALEALRLHGVMDKDLTIIKVTADEDYDAVIALGAVIRGGTPHFDYVAGECVKGLGQVSLNSDKPVAFGVLTVDNIEQAIERAGTKAGNKGAEAALTAVEMVSLLRQMNA